MNILTDQELLRQYADQRSEGAFAELVTRHVDFVHSAALRMVCDAHLAQDVTQGVFIALAKNAAQMTEHPVLSGWLHRTARNIAAQTVRTDVRRRAREQEVAAMNELLATAPEAGWEHIAPQLDEALGELNEPDRDAIFLHYFQRKSAREIAQVLGTSEEAAQKRLSRAVESLRVFFAKRGVTVGASGLVMLITANAVQAAPAGLALAITTATAALAGAAAQTSAAITATKAIAMTTFQKTLIAAALVAGLTTLVVQHQSQANLRQENQSLRSQLAQLQTDAGSFSSRLARAGGLAVPKLPAPRVQPGVAPAAPEETSSSNLISRILMGENPPKLTSEQTEAFARENQRSAASLLAAFRTSGNPALLEEAMQRFPNDPQVAFEAAFKRGASPEEQRHWLDVFKQTAPDNALANYVSAVNYFKSGQTDQAVQDLVAASRKSKFQDYTADRFQGDMEAYRSAGYAEAETSMAATWGLELPQLKPFKELTQSMLDLAASYRQAGDTASAQAVLQMAVNLGAQVEGANRSGGVPLVTQLVGIAIQRMALGAQDPAASYDAAGMTVAQRQQQLLSQKDAIHNVVEQMKPLQGRMTPQDWITYDQRSIMVGEQNAIQWLLNKYGTN